MPAAATYRAILILAAFVLKWQFPAFARTQTPDLARLKHTIPPPQQGNAPWNRDLMIRWSDDGNSFGAESVFTECAGVPSVAADAKGLLVAAFQWFPLQRADAFDRVAVRFSETGGVSWSEPVPITVAGYPAGYQRPFDPTIVFVPGSGFRIYFSSGPKGHEPPGQGANIATWSAISADGIHYQMEPEPRFTVADRRVIDCAVAYFGDRWHYSAPIGAPAEGAYYATSLDGLRFSRMPDIASTSRHNWTGNMVVLRERLRFYGSSPDGVWWSELSGQQWTGPRSTGVQGGDPAVAPGHSGKVFMIAVSGSRRNVPRPAHRK